MKTSAIALGVATLGVVGLAGEAGAANSTFYTDLASFSAAAGGALVSQDFSGYAGGANLRNVEFLPGVSVDSNMTDVEAFNGGLFGTGGRDLGNAFYDVKLTLPHKAVAFDVRSFEADPANASTAQDAGLMTVFFADATSAPLAISGSVAGDPIFFGVVSDTAITSIRWAEAHEGSGGTEETSLDNFYVVRGVPEPGSCVLSGVVLTVFAARRRR